MNPWDATSEELIELSLQWVIGQMAEGNMASLAGVGQLPDGDRVTFTLNADDDEAMLQMGREEVAKSAVTHFALLGVAALMAEGEELSVFVLYLQAPGDPKVTRYLAAFDFVDEEDGETSLTLSEWEEIDGLEESWLAKV